MKTAFITLVLLIATQIYVSATSNNDIIRFKNLTVDNGLSNNGVNCILQDYEGYIWIGTENGLNRYDGYQFKIFKHDAEDSVSLPSNFVKCLYQDSRNNLWIGTLFGLCRYNREKGNIERVNFNDNPDSTFKSPVGVIIEDNRKTLWIGTIEGLFYFDPGSNKYVNPFSDTIISSNYITDIHKDKNGILWVVVRSATKGWLYRYNPSNNELKQCKSVDSDSRINVIISDSEGDLWIGHQGNGLFVINEHTETIKQYQNDPNDQNSLSSNSILSLACGEDGKIFIGTDGGGLNVYNPQTKIFSRYLSSESEYSIINNKIKKIYVGDNGTTWIAGAGVSIYDKRFSRFIIYNNETTGKSLFEYPVTDFVEGIDGTIWISSDGGGIYFFNPAKNIISKYNQSEIYNSLNSNNVLALETDSNGDLWAGMWNGGLNYFKTENEKLILKQKYSQISKNISGSESVNKIYRDKNDNLWVGSYRRGLYVYNTVTRNFDYIPLTSKDGTDIDLITVTDICKDYEDNIWIAVWGSGLIKLDRKTGRRINYVNDNNNKLSLPGNIINVIFEDSKKRLWIGTLGNGISLFNRKDNNFITYSIKDGLPDENIVGILEDSYGNLWVSSNNGISKVTFDSVSMKIKVRNYDVNDGLQNKIFLRNATLKSSTGEMYFGGINGFNIFHPDSIKDNEVKPPVIITDFQLFNKPVLVGTKGSPLRKHISQTKKLILKYDQSIFTFHFVALNYINTEKNQYAFYMEGFENDWNYVGSKREATYTNLNPGNYVFRVKACNNDGIWNEEGASINITILPPWWRTIWFRTLVILFIIVLAVSIYLYRVRSLIRQKLKLEKLVKKRTQEIEEKNHELETQDESLREVNTLLEERQQYIEEQAEELRATTVDLSEKNETLRILNATKDKFFSIIAHDLKSPFSSVMGFTELLKTKFDQVNDEKKKLYIESLFQSVYKINKLLENLLQWARTQTGNIKFSPENYDLNEIINDNTELVQSTLKEKKINLIKDIPVNAIAHSDKNMITTVVRNLLSNALKYTEEGEIRIKIVSEGKMWQVNIEDTGKGIAENNLKTIFEIVQSKSTEGTRGEIGTGLGLIICKEFIEMNGGTISAASTPGKGSVFTFTVPALSES